jgi:hypothetical protein
VGTLKSEGVYEGMKLLKTLVKPLLAFVALALAAPCIQAAETAGVADPYQQAVAQYVGAAQGEVTFAREELAKLEKAKSKADLAGVREGIAQCAQLVDRLKNAGPSNFDKVKREYEAARAKLLEQIAVAQKG